jgi:hypothetical protein
MITCLLPWLFLFSGCSTDTPQDINVTLPAFLTLDEYFFERQDNWYYFTNKSYTREDLVSLEADAVSHIGTTDFFSMTINDVISLLGKPSKVVICKINSSEHLMLYYYNVNFYIGISGVNVKEIRLENLVTPYSYQSDLTFGSSPAAVTGKMGSPLATVTGQMNSWNDMTLYLDIEGQAGKGYISYHAAGVRFFFLENKIIAIYLYRPNFPV